MPAGRLLQASELLIEPAGQLRAGPPARPPGRRRSIWRGTADRRSACHSTRNRFVSPYLLERAAAARPKRLDHVDDEDVVQRKADEPHRGGQNQHDEDNDDEKVRHRRLVEQAGREERRHRRLERRERMSGRAEDQIRAVAPPAPISIGRPIVHQLTQVDGRFRVEGQKLLERVRQHAGLAGSARSRLRA